MKCFFAINVVRIYRGTEWEARWQSRSVLRRYNISMATAVVERLFYLNRPFAAFHPLCIINGGWHRFAPS